MLVSQRQGSVYLITIITVGAITAMALIGISLRQVGRSQSVLVSNMSTGSDTILTAAEYAIETVASDSNWATTAKTGVVYSTQTIGQSSISATVLDANTLNLPEDTTTNYRIVMNIDHEMVHQSARFDCTHGQIYPPLLATLGATKYWPLNEITGSEKAIETITSTHGDFLNPSGAGAGSFSSGSPVPLFESLDGEVMIPFSNDFKIRNGTLSLWAKFTGSEKSDSYGLAGMLFQSGGIPTISVLLHYGKIGCYLDEDNIFSVGNFAYTSDDLFDDGNWHHIAILWGSGGLAIYVDGILKASKESNTDALNSNRANRGGEQPLLLGAGYVNMWTATTKVPFPGSVARVSLFDSRLGADSIVALAQTDPDGKQLTIVDDSWVRIYE